MKMDINLLESVEVMNEDLQSWWDRVKRNWSGPSEVILHILSARKKEVKTEKDRNKLLIDIDASIHEIKLHQKKQDYTVAVVMLLIGPVGWPAAIVNAILTFIKNNKVEESYDKTLNILEKLKKEREEIRKMKVSG